MSKYYLAADGGGTKLLCCLYDENMHILSSAKTGGTNSLFRPAESVIAEEEDLLARLIPDEITELAGVDTSIVGETSVFRSVLERRCKIDSFVPRGEGHTAVACSLERYGIAAQAGTGSDAFYIQDGKYDAVGGWGATLGDEGSGYDIGLHTIKAAIYASDGRGPKSVLPELFLERWKLNGMWDIVHRISNNPEQRSIIASASYITEEAAKMGDAVALSVYDGAAHEMAHQVLTLLKRYNNIWDGPIVASGGAWKGHPRMFESFRREVLETYPEARVVRPLYEPIVGSVFLRLSDMGYTSSEIGGKLAGEFDRFLCKRPD